MNMGIGKIQITIIVFLILLMVIPPVSPHTSSTPSHKLNGISLNYSLQTPVKNVNKSNNTPKYIFPLSNSTKLDMENGHITPINYNRSPAPMGISDLGLVNKSGNISGFNLSTNGFRGILNISNMSRIKTLYSDQFSVQLNAVLAKVNISSKCYDFWTQNVAVVNLRTKTVSLVDNVWDFNYYVLNPSILQGYGSIYNSFVYIDYGPVFHFNNSLSISLSLSTLNVLNATHVFFNYRIITNGSTNNGTFDNVLLKNQVSNTFPATYLISGKGYVNSYAAFDAEFTIGGKYGGRNIDFLNFNGSMKLDYLNSSQYVPVNSSFDYGIDTGETSAGIAFTWNNESAYVTQGPSVLYGMWNNSQSYTSKKYTVSVKPENAFAFVGLSMPDNNTSYSWVPLDAKGSLNFSLPDLNFSLALLLSGYNEFITNMSTSNISINLQKNSSFGVYTPLEAVNTCQLASISTSGNGTIGHPYELINFSYPFKQTLYSKFFSNANTYSYRVLCNDFVTISNVDVYARISNIEGIGMTLTNVSRISVVNNSCDSILLINSSDNILYGNNLSCFFPTTLVNSSFNYIAGNLFSGGYYLSSNSYGIKIEGHGNYVFNNEFLFKNAVVEANNTTDGGMNYFNTTAIRLKEGFIVNGMNISNPPFTFNATGGNLWTFNTASTPYSDGSMYTPDYHPSVGMVLSSKLNLRPVNFVGRNEVYNSVVNYSWIDIKMGSGYIEELSLVKTYNMPILNYSYYLYSFNSFCFPFLSFHFKNRSGNISANTRVKIINITVCDTTSLSAIINSNLPAGSSFYIWLNETNGSFNYPLYYEASIDQNVIPMLLPDGNFTFSAHATGYVSVSGKFSINGSNTSIVINFKKIMQVVINVNPSSSSLLINGTNETLTNGTMTISMPTGTYCLKATSKGYNNYSEKIVILANSTNVFYINLTKPTTIYGKIITFLESDLFIISSITCLFIAASFLYVYRKKISK